MKYFMVVGLFLLVGCSTSSEFTHFQKSDQFLSVSEKWNIKLPGLATDLNLAKDTQHILVGVIPDYDQAQRPISRPHLVLYSHDGKELWKKELGSKVKSQAIADNAEMIITSTYDNRLTAYNKKGKMLWQKKDFCQPYVLTQTKKIICYYDDDSRPHVAFSIYNWSGKRLKQYKTKQEVLDLSYSHDEKWIVISLVGGEVRLLNSRYKTVWSKKVSGEVIRTSLSYENLPKVAILFNESFKVDENKRTRQKVSLLSHSGKLIQEQILENIADQIEFSSDSQKIYFYGNHARGQELASLDTKLNLQWKLSDRHHADYGSLLQIAKEEVIVGFEDVTTNGSPNSFLFGFDSSGKVKWQIPLNTSDGAYLYSNRFTSNDHFITLVTDEGDLRAYFLKN